SGDELARMKKQGVQIQYTLEVPLVTYLGDTGPGPVFESPDVTEAQILITECTFFEPEHRPRSRDGRHLHASHLVEMLPTLHNDHIVLIHVSRRSGLPRSKRWLKKLLGGSIPGNIHFL